MTPDRWAKIEELYHSALDRDGTDRAAYLDEASAGDEALRQEVESLLVHGRGMTSFLEEPALEKLAKGLNKKVGQLLIGRELGSYQIISLLGAGGMGEVYRARDTRLDRIVAIKVFPQQFANQTDLRERFEREARAIASLNHPHICVLHDVGRQDGMDYLVLEYLEGETLADRVKKGPLPLVEVLRYAVEIADALDKAHRKGITHRDLKPGNIMLTKSGAKLLDFGLAKLGRIAGQAKSLSELPTEKDAITAQGTILGTLQYMAPEQVEGKQVDARTDIFAFGVVIYEMATARKAFEGQSQGSLVAKILDAEPIPMSSLQPMTPPALDHLVNRCLAKDPDERWQSAKDICEQLRWISGSIPASAEVKSVPAYKNWRKTLAWTAMGVVACAIVGIFAWMYKPAPTQPVTRTVINLAPGQQLAGLENGPAVALSPDGTHLAYVARQGGTQQIYLRAMDSLEARPIPGSEGAVNPFFSPDDQWLGFFASGKLNKVSVSGGAAVILGDAGNPRGASWGSQGIIAFTPSPTSLLLQAPGAGGVERWLIRSKEVGNGEQWPEFLPGGKAVLFVAGTSGSDSGVAVQSLGTGERRDLIPGATQPRYASSGHLVYGQRGSLLAVPFDPQRLAVTGGPVPLVDGVLQSPISGATHYSIANNGSLVYVLGGVRSIQRRLVWVNRNGAEQPLGAPARAYQYPRLSPDGRRIAVGINEQDFQIWLYDVSQEMLTRFTFAGNFNNSATWTPDGKRIAFMSNSDGPSNVFWQLADGSGSPERLTTGVNRQIPQSWSPDGQKLAFFQINPNKETGIWMLRMSDRKAQPFVEAAFDAMTPRFSPDGSWLAYVSDESGRGEVYIQSYPGPGGKRQITTEGGTEPVWNPNGREMFYRSGGKMMAVDIATQPSFLVGKPRLLFEGPYLPSPLAPPNYDVSPDGQRFLMVKPAEQEQAPPTQINVVLNWFEELKRRVPTGTK
jgi:Tol biopolymer transport system component